MLIISLFSFLFEFYPDPNLIYSGQVLKNDGTTGAAVITYTVTSGDTLSAIADKYNTTINDFK